MQTKYITLHLATSRQETSLSPKQLSLSRGSSLFLSISSWAFQRGRQIRFSSCTRLEKAINTHVSHEENFSVSFSCDLKDLTILLSISIIFNVTIMVYFNMGSQNKPGEILIFTGFIVLYISRLGFCYDLACNLVVKPHLNSVSIFVKTLACEAHTLPPTA